LKIDNWTGMETTNTIEQALAEQQLPFMDDAAKSVVE
jgi:hypothetical protein